MTIALISAQVIRGYLRWMRAKKLAPTTVKSASSALHGLARETGAHILEIGRPEMRAWQRTRSEELAASTLLKDITYIRGFYRWAIDEDLLAEDPSRWLDAPETPRRLPRPIEDVDFKAALDAAGDDDLRVILGLARYAGLRACEIAGLDWREVTLRGTSPRLRVLGKGSKERIVDVCPDLADLLAALPHRTGPVVRRRDGKGGRVKPTRVSQLANDLLHTCGISNTLHGLRHQFVTRVNDVAGLRAAQEAAGHANPQTTAGYAHITARKLRAAIVAAGELDLDGTAPACH